MLTLEEIKAKMRESERNRHIHTIDDDDDDDDNLTLGELNEMWGTDLGSTDYDVDDIPGMRG